MPLTALVASGTPGAVSTSAGLAAGDVLVLVGNCDGPTDFLAGTLSNGVNTLLIQTRGTRNGAVCIATFYLAHTYPAGSTLTISGVRSFVAFGLSGVRQYGHVGGVSFGQGNAGSRRTAPVHPYYEDHTRVLAVAGTGGAASGSTVIGSADDGSGNYVTALYEDANACGAHEYAYTAAGPHQAVAYYLGQTGSAACAAAATPDLIPLPAHGTVPASGGLCPAGYYNDSGTCRLYPSWFDLDFAYLPGSGGRVVACVPIAANGNYGELQVWRYDDAWPPNTAGSDVLLTEDAHCCSLCVTPDGRVHLFYRLASDSAPVRVRESRDGGVTWEAEQEIDCGFTSQAVTNATIGQNHGGHPMPVAYSAKRERLLLGTEASTGSGDFEWLVLLKRNAAGDGWEYLAKASTSSAGGDGWGLEALPDGTWRKGRRRVVNFFDDGTFEEELESGTFVANFPLATDPRVGVGMTMNRRTGGTLSAPGEGTADIGRRAYAAEVAFYQADRTWESGPLRSFLHRYPAEYLESVPQFGVVKTPAVAIDNTAYSSPTAYVSSAAMLRVHPSGFFEFLAPDEAGSLRFYRARAVPDSGAFVWEGR